MKDLVEYMVKSIVKNPDEVIVNEEYLDDGNSSLKHLQLNIKVNEADIPIVIGKGGRTIRAIRNLSKIKAVRDNIYLEINVE